MDWNKELVYAQFLHRTRGLKKKDKEKLVQHFGGCLAAYGATAKEVESLLDETAAKVLEREKRGRCALQEYEEMTKKGISFVYKGHPHYPRRLKDIPDAPFGLYYRGSLPREDRKSVAVIGARRCSGYGAHMAALLGKHLALAGIQVISGMAKGIDGISQQAALQAGGSSFAVLGSGADVCYPASNKELYEGLVQQGGVLSEYPPGSPPIAEQFPPRNRIISGLSDVVVVVEARQKSGTLITVDMALEQGREIYCVPGRVTDLLSDGCNKLISQGAGIVWSVEEFLEKGIACEFGTFSQEPARRQMSAGEQALWKLLDYDPVSLEQLYIQLVSEKGMEQVTMPEMLEILTNLQIHDLVQNVGGSYYAKKG